MFVFDVEKEHELEKRFRIGEFLDEKERNETIRNDKRNQRVNINDIVPKYKELVTQAQKDNMSLKEFINNATGLFTYDDDNDDDILSIEHHVYKNSSINYNMEHGGENDKTILSKMKIAVPAFERPVESVNYIETIFEKVLLENNTSVFKLKNFKHQTHLENNVIQRINTQNLSERIFRTDQPNVSCISVCDDFLALGDVKGVINLYSLSKARCLRALTLQDTESSSNNAVLSMDMTKPELTSNYYILIASYLNGSIALYDCMSGICKKIISDIHLNTAVLHVTFLKAVNKEYNILTADIKGVVNKINISDGFFRVAYDTEKILEHKHAVCAVTSLTFTQKEIDTYYTNKEQPTILAIACLDFITVNQIKPEVKRLKHVGRSSYFEKYPSKYLIPDCCFGFGYFPHGLDYNELDSTALYRLFAIAWGKVVYLNYIPISPEGEVGAFELIGHYVHDCQILRVSFVGNSVLLIYDSRNVFTLLHTLRFTAGEVKFDSDSLPIPTFYNNSNKLTPVIETRKLNEDEFIFQKRIPDVIEQNSSFNKESYYNTIIINDNKVYSLSKQKKLCWFKVQTWNELIRNYEQTSEWLEALSMGLQIYKGTNLVLPGIPLNKQLREETVKHSVRKMILNYLSVSIEMNVSAINDCVDVVIELCIEMDDIDYLFNTLLPQLERCGLGDLLFERLEPFILSDRIRNQNIGNSVAKIVDLYINTNQLEILSRVLTHFDVKAIQDENIKQICIHNNLLTPLIYIYMNGGDGEEDCFKPIEIIYEIYTKATVISNDEMNSYNNCLNKVDIHKLEHSKQYIYHKLFWYINLVLSQHKFPHKSDNIIDDKQFTFLVPKILLWLLHNERIKDFLAFDPFTYLTTMSRFFTEMNVYNKIIALAYDKSKCQYIYYSGSQIMDFRPMTFVDVIIEKCKKVENVPTLFDMYYFICTIAINVDAIDKPLLMEASKFLLKFNEEIERGLKQDSKLYSYHYNFWKAKDFYKRISNTIMNMIEHYLTRFTKDELNFLLEISMKNSLYIYATIFLLIKTDNYVRCLSVYLNDEGYIDDKVTETFEFISQSFDALEKEVGKFRDFKDKVLSHFLELSKLSIEHLVELNITWYESDHKRALLQLEKDEYKQLEYVEKVLTTYKIDELPVDNDEIELYYYLLAQHIELLCSLNKIEEIVPNLEQRPSYPIERCLPTCLKYKAFDAAIFFYKTKGDYNAAFEISLNIMNENIIEIKEAIKTSNQENYNKYISVHCGMNLNRTLAICLENSEKKLSDDETMWLNLLKYFYDVLTQLKQFEVNSEFENNNNVKSLLESFNQSIHENIENVLIAMHPYISILTIMDFRMKLDKDAKYKEFKKVFEYILTSYSTNTDMLITIKKVMCRAVLKDLQEVIDESVKGFTYRFNICDKCNKPFDVSEMTNGRNSHWIYVFKCGHKLHSKCCQMKTAEERDCVVCEPRKESQNEVEEKAVNFGNNAKIIGRGASVIHRSSGIRQSEGVLAKKGDPKKYQEQLKKLAFLDKNFIEATQMITKENEI